MGDISINLDQNTIENQIKSVIHAQVLSALNDKSSIMMDNFVNSVLTQKVDSQGQRSSYSGMTFMQWVAQEGIKKSIEEASKEWVAKQIPEIKRKVKNQLDKNKKSIMDEIVTQIVNGLENSFSASISIRLKNENNY